MLFASRDTVILVQEQLNAVFDKTTGNFNLQYNNNNNCDIGYW